MKQIKVGMVIETTSVNGQVIEAIQGLELGWDDTMYYVVRATYPRKMSGEVHVVRLDSVQKATCQTKK